MGIDKYAYNSRLAATRTFDKLIFSLLPLFVCLFSNSNIVSLTVLSVMGVSTIYWSGLSVRKYLKLLTLPLTFLILGTLTIIIQAIDATDISVIHTAPIFGKTYGITKQSLEGGMELILKSIAAVSCLYFFSLNTTMNSFFNSLRKSKLPSVLIELMELIYRFIFVIGSEANRIYTAQASRLGYRSFLVGLKSLGVLAAALFVKALGRTERLNYALEARNFRGSYEYLIIKDEKCIAFSIGGILFAVFLICLKLAEQFVI